MGAGASTGSAGAVLASNGAPKDGESSWTSKGQAARAKLRTGLLMSTARLGDVEQDMRRVAPEELDTSTLGVPASAFGDVKGDITALCCVPGASVVIIGTNKGDIVSVKLREGSSAAREQTFGGLEGERIACLVAGGGTLYAGDSKGRVGRWPAVAATDYGGAARPHGAPLACGGGGVNALAVLHRTRANATRSPPVFVGLHSGEIQVWSSGGERTRVIEGAHAGGVRSLAFASDYLFSGGATDGAVKANLRSKVWVGDTFDSGDGETYEQGDLLEELDARGEDSVGDEEAIMSICVRDDTLLAGTSAGGLKMWNVFSLDALTPLVGHSGAVSLAALSAYCAFSVATERSGAPRARCWGRQWGGAKVQWEMRKGAGAVAAWDPVMKLLYATTESGGLLALEVESQEGVMPDDELDAKALSRRASLAAPPSDGPLVKSPKKASRWRKTFGRILTTLRITRAAKVAPGAPKKIAYPRYMEWAEELKQEDRVIRSTSTKKMAVFK